MAAEELPIYQIQDFNLLTQRDRYFYLSPFDAHLQEHLFIQKPHKHDFFIILFITAGTGVHTIDFKEYPVKARTIFFMTPGQVHSWNLSEDVNGYIIFFTPEYYLQEFSHKSLYSFPFFNNVLHIPAFSVSEAEETSLLGIVHMLEQEYLKQDLMKDEMLRRYLDILLILLRRMYQANNTEKFFVSGTFSQLQQLEALINKHYKEHLPVVFYADQLNVTVKQLNDFCRRTLQKTTSELLQERLLLEAQRLLVHSDLTITQIAAQLGYFDNAYFFRFFKKRTGTTPEQFRNEQH